MVEIRAVLIFEMLGRPAEHLKTTLEQFLDKVSKENGVEVVNKKVHEPKQIGDTKQELFTTFSETEINFKTLQDLLKIVFVYMPSHVEIVSPQEMSLKNFDLNTLINELVRKLHQYDEIAKRLAIERSILQQQLQQQGVKPAIPTMPSPEAKTKEIRKKTSKKTGKKKKKK